MQIVKAALEAYAKQYSRLGIRLNHAEALALVESVIQLENVQPKPSSEDLHAIAEALVSRVAEMSAKQSV